LYSLFPANGARLPFDLVAHLQEGLQARVAVSLCYVPAATANCLFRLGRIKQLRHSAHQVTDP